MVQLESNVSSLYSKSKITFLAENRSLEKLDYTNLETVVTYGPHSASISLNDFLPLIKFRKVTVKFNIKVSHSSHLLMFLDETSKLRTIRGFGS